MTEPNSSTPRRPVSSLIVRLALAAASAGALLLTVAALVVSFQRKEIPFAVERNWLWMSTELTAP